MKNVMIILLGLCSTASAADLVLMGETNGTGTMRKPVETLTVKFYQNADVTAKIERRESILKEIQVLLTELSNIKIDVKQQYKVTVDK